MESFFIIALIGLALAAVVLLLLSWGAYAGKTKLLWRHGGGVMAGGRYWFVLTPAIMVGSVLAIAAAVLVEANPETSGLFAENPSDPLPATIIVVTAGFLVLSLVASYWLPGPLKPRWIREAEADEAEAQVTRDQSRRRG